MIVGMERIKKAGEGKPDRVPVYAQMSHHSARIAGEKTYNFFTDADIFLRCELQADEFYGFDAPTIHYDCYNIEAEALGAKLVYPENEAPIVDPRKPLMRSIDDLKALEPVKMGRSGRMPFVLGINDRLADAGLSPKIRFCGIFTLGTKLLGYENLIVAIRNQPTKVHRLLQFLTDEVAAEWVLCQREHAGVNAVATGSEAFASPPLLALDMVEEFSLQYIKRLEKHIGGIRLAGLWGEGYLDEPTKLLDIKRRGAPGSIQVCDPDVSELGPTFFKRYADAHGIGLIMGLDAHLVRSGPVSEIESRARRFIDEAGLDGRFILFINDIPYDTPSEHVQAVVSVAHEFVYT
jgi:uroporphyrinogen-III decarboxylase